MLDVCLGPGTGRPSWALQCRLNGLVKFFLSLSLSPQTLGGFVHVDILALLAAWTEFISLSLHAVCPDPSEEHRHPAAFRQLADIGDTGLSNVIVALEQILKTAFWHTCGLATKNAMCSFSTG